MKNSVDPDPDQMDSLGAICSGSTLVFKANAYSGSAEQGLTVVSKQIW